MESWNIVVAHGPNKDVKKKEKDISEVAQFCG